MRITLLLLLAFSSCMSKGFENLHCATSNARLEDILLQKYSAYMHALKSGNKAILRDMVNKTVTIDKDFITTENLVIKRVKSVESYSVNCNGDMCALSLKVQYEDTDFTRYELLFECIDGTLNINNVDLIHKDYVDSYDTNKVYKPMLDR